MAASPLERDHGDGMDVRRRDPSPRSARAEDVSPETRHRRDRDGGDSNCQADRSGLAHVVGRHS